MVAIRTRSLDWMKKLKYDYWKTSLNRLHSVQCQSACFGAATVNDGWRIGSAVLLLLSLSDAVFALHWASLWAFTSSENTGNGFRVVHSMRVTPLSSHVRFEIYDLQRQKGNLLRSPALHE
jgi:hypothetical protein